VSRSSVTKKIKLSVDYLDKTLDILQVVCDSDDIDFSAIDDIMNDIGDLKEDVIALLDEL
jgi:hypothetical protein